MDNVDRSCDAMIFVRDGEAIVVCVGHSSDNGHNGWETGCDPVRPRCMIELPTTGISADPVVLWSMLSEGVGLGELYSISMLPKHEHKQTRRGTLVAVAYNRSAREMAQVLQ